MPDKPSDLYGSIEIATDKKSKAKPPPKRSASQGRKSKKIRPPKKKKATGKWLVWCGILFFLIILYNVAGFLLVPHLIKNSLSNYLADKANLQYEVDRVRFNPYSFVLEMNGLNLSNRPAGQTESKLLSLDDFRINLDLLSLLRGDLVCSSMTAKGLDLKIIRNQDKSYNISPLLRRKSTRNQAEFMDFAELPFLFSLNNISISNSRVTIDDRITGKEHLIEDITLALPALSNFAYQTSSYIHPQFSAVINGSPISLSGEAPLAGEHFDGRQTQLSCDLNNIDIPIYFDYLPVSLPVDITEGKVNGKLQLVFANEKDKGNKLSIQFDLSSANIKAETRDGKLTLSAPLARFEGTFEPFSRNLSFQNILFREPAITSEGELDRVTLASLTPLTLRPTDDDQLRQVIPSLSVKLLIADGGSFTVKNQQKKQRSQTWHSIQLSIKNFANERTTPEMEEGSFRLSGEHEDSPAFFSWQGGFDSQNHPSGNLQLNNVPASLIAPFFARKANDIEGTADLKGLLNLSLSEGKEGLFDYSLKSTTVNIKEFQLKEKGTVWLRSPNLRCEPVSRINGVIDIGNAFLPNSTLIINRDHLPFLFSVFSNKTGRHVAHGLDLSGTVKIVDDNLKAPVLSLKELTFQANKLEQQQAQPNNFVFSANIEGAGEIKAKGSLHLTPLQLSAQMSVSKLPPGQLFTWFTKSKTLIDSKAELSLRGTFSYPQQEFAGELSAKNLVIGDPQKPVFQAQNTQFNNFSWSRTRKSLSIGRLLVDQPEFSWHRAEEDANPVMLTSIFLRHILLPEPDAKDSDPDASIARFTLALDQLKISDGSISYRDQRLVPTLSLGLTGINGTIDKINYPIAEQNSQISINGNIEGRPFNLQGKGNLLQSPPAAGITMQTEALPLELFTSQIEARIKGVDISGATADISSSASWSKDTESSHATLTVTGLAPKSSDSPTSVALALLTGADGKTSFSFSSGGNHVESTLLNEAIEHYATQLVKASINPILLAPADFRDLVENQYVTFQPGTAILTGESVERLGRYNEFISLYPKLSMQIQGLADRIVDTPVLLTELMRLEKARVDEENRRRALEWQKRKEQESRNRLDAQGNAIDETDIKERDDTFVPVTARKVRVTDEMLEDLAMKREQTVISYLVERLTVPEKRVIHSQNKRNRIRENGTFNRADILLSTWAGDVNSGG